MKHPDAAWTQVHRDWQTLGFVSEPDLQAAGREFDALVALLEAEGVRVSLLQGNDSTDADSLYTHDPGTTIGHGLVLGSMGKPNRRHEPAALLTWAREAGVDVLGAVEAPGLLEGGDLIWLDHKTVALGIGFRSNESGARQLEELTGLKVIRVPLPWFQGPGDVLHLMSLISPLAEDLALVHRPLLPVPFLQELQARGIRTVDLPPHEYDSLGCNVLALAPRRCLMVHGNPDTRAVLESAGCEVLTFQGDEIARKGLGGPTCLTRPLVRG
ncbi:MAG: hypothetical protein JJ896_13675 [Rhodothermales bacterium]|nr:hypothetical protein [Rhodothermales bacterium]MBO6780698.1 hypothetical protein [Rhodothermales bacterium]